jgi:hypothetical protein
MFDRVHGLAWKITAFTAVSVVFFGQAAALASMPASGQRKSASLVIGATVPPYAGMQSRVLRGSAPYISRFPGQRYY